MRSRPCSPSCAFLSEISLTSLEKDKPSVLYLNSHPGRTITSRRIFSSSLQANATTGKSNISACRAILAKRERSPAAVRLCASLFCVTRTILIESGDWAWDESTGRPKTVQDGPKVLQDLQECMTISVQSNGFGAGIEEVVGTVPASVPAAALDVQLRATRAVQRLAQLQRQAQFAQRPPAERVSRVDGFSARTVLAASGTSIDPTKIAIGIDVRTEAGETASLQGLLSR